MTSSKKFQKIRKFLSYYAPYKGLLIADLVSSIFVAALALILPVCVRYITKDVMENGTENILTAILQTGALMLFIIVLQTGFAMFSDYKGHDMGAKIERDMRMELFGHFQKLSFRFYDSQKTGQLMSRLTNDLLNLTELYHHGPENLVIYGTQFIGSLIILLHINVRLTLVICLFLPVMGIYSFVFFGKLQKAYAKSRSCIAEVNRQAEENLSGIRAVKSFANEELEIRKFSEENSRFYQSRAAIYKNEALHYTVIETFFTQLITVAIIVAGGIWIAGAKLDVPDLLVFILYAAYLTSPVPKLAFMVQQYQEGISGYERFREIMELTLEIQDEENALEVQVKEGRVEFRSVTFRYSEGQDYVLRNISLDVQAGETVAIVGPSGIGKTTLCSLIPRFYDVLEGEICIDGINVRDMALHPLRQQIGIVRQETFLFAGTVMENILYGRPGATEAEAVEAAKKANAHEFIMELPNGYDTDIGQRGVKLSGGQQQRISIARVFLKNPPILIFDEATSALDYKSEKAVMDSLRTLAEGHTLFIIAHRLSTVRNADRIVVLTKEGIAEQGTHEQLYGRNGIYAKLYNAQEL
ncbi:ATP-binding cassette subfamily B protein [Anaerotaenia torta]|uniref:ABC transporter ATP-binding protein n=1 Tax=Anaerotaenia torta TaxID=433293 RepID=UPI003D251200